MSFSVHTVSKNLFFIHSFTFSNKIAFFQWFGRASNARKQSQQGHWRRLVSTPFSHNENTLTEIFIYSNVTKNQKWQFRFLRREIARFFLFQILSQAINLKSCVQIGSRAKLKHANILWLARLSLVSPKKKQTNILCGNYFEFHVIWHNIN